MRAPVLSLVASTLLVAACSSPAPQAAPATPAAGATATPPAGNTAIVGDITADVSELEKKMVDLAKAIPAAKYGYRPSAGVRSVQEVLMHVASDNYFMPAALGATPPAWTGITLADGNSAGAFEKRRVTPDSAVAQMSASFAFLKDAMQKQDAASLVAKQKMFGSEYTGQQVLVMTATHLHEHLGQLIAYARANNVTPPWSK